jgi:hypothetical protein
VGAIDAVIERWQWRLGLVEWTARRERISPLQVVDETGMPGNELIGVVLEALAFTIVHTRDLTEHDVIHELLHVAFPEWEHDQIELWTDLLASDEEHSGGLKVASDGGRQRLEIPAE